MDDRPRQLDLAAPIQTANTKAAAPAAGATSADLWMTPYKALRYDPCDNISPVNPQWVKELTAQTATRFGNAYSVLVGVFRMTAIKLTTASAAGAYKGVWLLAPPSCLTGTNIRHPRSSAHGLTAREGRQADHIFIRAPLRSLAASGGKSRGMTSSMHCSFASCSIAAQK